MLFIKSFKYLKKNRSYSNFFISKRIILLVIANSDVTKFRLQITIVQFLDRNVMHYVVE